MSDNIFGTRFAGHREPAWHGLGTVFNEPLALEEAARLADVLYQVKKHPLVVRARGQDIEVPNQVSLVREPTNDDPQPRLFGIVGKRYSVIQNEELVRILNPLSEVWPTETVGALGYGETIFMTLYAGTTEIRGEEIRKFFLVTDDKSGGHALRIAFTPVRVVCQNTLMLALGSALLSVSLKHYENLRDELNFQMKLIGEMRRSEAEAMESFEFLSTKFLVEDQIEEILKQVYPDPVKPRRVTLAESVPLDVFSGDVSDAVVRRYRDAQDAYEVALNRVASYRNGAKMLYDNFPQRNTAGTAWAIYNTIVETEDYRRGGNAQESALFGPRAARKAKAFKVAMEI